MSNSPQIAHSPADSNQAALPFSPKQSELAGIQGNTVNSNSPLPLLPRAPVISESTDTQVGESNYGESQHQTSVIQMPESSKDTARSLDEIVAQNRTYLEFLAEARVFKSMHNISALAKLTYDTVSLTQGIGQKRAPLHQLAVNAAKLCVRFYLSFKATNDQDYWSRKTVVAIARLHRVYKLTKEIKLKRSQVDLKAASKQIQEKEGVNKLTAIMLSEGQNIGKSSYAILEELYQYEKSSLASGLK
ncbi:hypothetical protein CPB83DRAFT_941807 [Crepidotus variabilis]|uniref:Uncharacterized protein n=1 Tax=Crepidotus variabilis TaxID=179855 RepID=A0A9P6EAZ4_9AGAR|nr:hypothetical protein CPB83DRAFT_941807 [Crepidotus variabilis]